jgi:hypothetical protein
VSRFTPHHGGPARMVSIEELGNAAYEDLNGRIVTVSSEPKYRIVFVCDDWSIPPHDRHIRGQRRVFELTFDEVQESTATPSSSGILSVVDDHPLLWNYNEKHLEMYFSSAPDDPLSLVGMLYAAHGRLLRGWRRLGEYLHAGPELLKQGYGQFAKGPRRVIEEYSRVVGTRCRYTILQGHTPRGGCRVVLFDHCYVVCRGISVVERVNEPSP